MDYSLHSHHTGELVEKENVKLGSTIKFIVVLIDDIPMLYVSLCYMFFLFFMSYVVFIMSLHRFTINFVFNIKFVLTRKLSILMVLLTLTLLIRFPFPQKLFYCITYVLLYISSSLAH
ncbi:hypothetical protein ACP275_09G114900 [Erythranthe tilingii]